MANEGQAERESAMEAMSAEQTKQTMFLAAYAIAFAISLKILATIALPLMIVALPIAYMYATQNCPSNDSFDAKVELKRVMRGQHLPESQAKPKGFIEQAISKAKATVETNLATSMGYEVTLANFGGAFTVATVRYPVMQQDLFWIGAFGEWRYLGCREIPEDSKLD